MKIERRGKYPGIKVHIDPPDWKAITSGDLTVSALQWVKKLIKAVKDEEKTHPNLWAERTPKEIEDELKLEKAKAESKLAKLKGGLTWNEKAHLIRCTRCNNVGPAANAEPIEDPALLAAGLTHMCLENMQGVVPVIGWGTCGGYCRVEETPD